MNVSVIIPTLNAEKYLPAILEKLRKYLKSPTSEVIIIDSSSHDETVNVAQSYGANVIQIPRCEFNHGGTRNLAAKKARGDILVYLTQDALPVDETSIEKLIKPFYEYTDIGMAYGRQLPYPSTGFFGTFARYFNYGPQSQFKTLADVNRLGIKTVFASNSFAAYRREALELIGGFPTDVILGEDTYVAAKMIQSNLIVAYVAEAQVYHAHDYNIKDEFKRYFDIGVFHSREKWILDEFSKAESEGYNYVKEEFKYLLSQKKYYFIPAFIIRNASKYLGYKLGTFEEYIPLFIKKRLSMHKNYW